MVTFDCKHNFCIECFKGNYELKINSGTDSDWSCVECKKPNPNEKDKFINHLQLFTMLVRL